MRGQVFVIQVSAEPGESLVTGEDLAKLLQGYDCSSDCEGRKVIAHRIVEVSLVD